MNALKEVETILQSEAVLATHLHPNPPQEILKEKLLFRIRAVKKAKNNKYVLLNDPDEKLEKIISHLSGSKNPTILPLADPEWHAVHTVIDENDFWNVRENFKAHGAQDILVLPIQKIIP